MKLNEIISILKRLYKEHVKKYWKRIVLSIVLSIIVAAATASTAWLLDPAVKKIFIDVKVAKIFLVLMKFVSHML